jgi:hypothetical protein
MLGEHAAGPEWNPQSTKVSGAGRHEARALRRGRIRGAAFGVDVGAHTTAVARQLIGERHLAGAGDRLQGLDQPALQGNALVRILGDWTRDAEDERQEIIGFKPGEMRRDFSR